MKEFKLIKSLSSNSSIKHTRKIIQGENLEALELLTKDYTEKIKCIYIDPPYNNGENYTHYDDSIHEEWIIEIKKRLRKLKPLLTLDGSIWISIDDSEVHYLKVAADEIFDRKNFVTTIIWQQRTTRENRKIFSNNHEYILVYAKDKSKFSKAINKLDGNDEQVARYKNPDNDIRGAWQSISLNVQAGHAVKSQFYEIISPSGKIHNPPKGRCWVYNEEKMKNLIEDGRIWFGNNGSGVPRLKKFLSESEIKITPETLWLGNDVGTNKEAKKHLIKLFPDKEVFDTPKPERLLKRIFEIATNEGDLILDAYVGAGTTIAVAHKMKRQYIGIDKGEHIIDYVVERQNLVLEGKSLGVLERKSDKNEGFEFYQIINVNKNR
ncbi:site-specific DNA-methyltransferase [Elizabethkingia anophelis]|uniref:site-specific DNA-methyltransferase n=1 Tax=Elizabethkingia anophelis TaxID=1117645 RepID=UPI00293CC9CB|nr:site-specific DNA-methyltransferase [Elizabethkingia anophelis]